MRPLRGGLEGGTASPDRGLPGGDGRSGAIGAVARLLVLELVYRRRQGERPTPEEYQARFSARVNLVGKALGEADLSVSQDPQSPTRSYHPGRESPDPEGPLAQLPEKSIRKAGWPEIADYDILAELGHGGMGVVYQARQHQLNRLVALKLIRAGIQARREDLDRFRLEAETVAWLHHANIVQIYDIGEASLCRAGVVGRGQPSPTGWPARPRVARRPS